MRVAILGSTGQLGVDLVSAFASTGEEKVFALSHADVEVTHPESVRRALTEIRPDVVINCAAFVRVDECEDRPEEAFRVNTLGVLHVAGTCAETGALCVHISTDFVFDGRKGSPYVEDDSPSPLNVYGASKLAGEHLLRAAAPLHLIVRTASLFGVTGSRGKGGNFLETIIRKAKVGEKLRVISDVYMSPTYTRDAASKILELIRSGAPSGTYHLANSGYCNWYEFAETIFHLLGVKPDLVPESVATYPLKARRPLFSALASERLALAGLQPMRPWREAVVAYLVEKGYLPGEQKNPVERIPPHVSR